jgi:hypothetical protein
VDTRQRSEQDDLVDAEVGLHHVSLHAGSERARVSVSRCLQLWLVSEIADAVRRTITD